MRRGWVALLVLLLCATPVVAHVPSFPEENTTPETAIDVPNPVKSRVFYDSLHGGQAKYYRLTVPAGERLYVETFTPRRDGLTPSIVVMSPGIETRDSVPDGVTVPDGMGALVVEGTRPEHARYELFTPSANYHTATFEADVLRERSYLIAIYEPDNQSGPVGVTIGYEEEFSPTEYLGVAFDRIRIHLWEGQHPVSVFGPYLLTILAGIGVVGGRWRAHWENEFPRLGLTVGGLLLVGTGVNTFVQMGLALEQTGLTLAALVTGLFILIPLGGGAWTVRLGLQADYSLPMRRRLALGLIGVLAVLTWAGFIVGPVILMGIAVLPTGVLKD